MHRADGSFKSKIVEVTDVVGIASVIIEATEINPLHKMFRNLWFFLKKIVGNGCSGFVRYSLGKSCSKGFNSFTQDVSNPDLFLK